MLANKAIKSISIMVVICFSLIISIPMVILSTTLSHYGRIIESVTFYYKPLNSSIIEELNIISDLGNIEIEYIDPPVDYFVKIDVNIEMVGSGLAEKIYSDYFDINEGNITGSPIDFSMKFLSDIYDPEVSSLIKDVSIKVNLRKDIIFDISVTLINGRVSINVPFNVRINNMKVNITKGNILFDLSNCIVEGNITGIANQSNIELRTYNVQYTRNSIWYLKNDAGDIKFDIFQSNEMGANVTGIGEIYSNNAIINVVYYDTSTNVGAVITFNNWAEYFPSPCTWIGFNYSYLYTDPMGYIFKSYDFPTKNSYNLTLHRNTVENSNPYYWNLYSEPIDNN